MTALINPRIPFSAYCATGLILQKGLSTIAETVASEAVGFVIKEMHPVIMGCAIASIYLLGQEIQRTYNAEIPRLGNVLLGQVLGIFPAEILLKKLGLVEKKTEKREKTPTEPEAYPICPFEIEEFKKCNQLQEEAEKSALICEAPSRAYNQSRQFQLLKNRGLNSNLQIAQEILKDVLGAVRFSPNYMARSWKIIEERAKTQGVLLKDLPELDLSCFVPQMERCFRSNSPFSTSSPNPFSARKKSAIISSKMSIGNCFEMASVALFKAMEKGVWNTRLDITSIANGDHAFLVMGVESPNSAVVIDAWANEVYPFMDLPNRLHDYVTTDMKTGMPELKQLDFSSQYLEIDISNIYSTEDLIDFKNNNSMNDDQIRVYDQVIQCMNRFHLTEDLDTKLIHAKQVSELCIDPSIHSLYPMKLLKAQIDHFIELSHQWP